MWKDVLQELVFQLYYMVNVEIWSVVRKALLFEGSRPLNCVCSAHWHSLCQHKV